MAYNILLISLDNLYNTEAYAYLENEEDEKGILLESMTIQNYKINQNNDMCMIVYNEYE